MTVLGHCFRLGVGLSFILLCACGGGGSSGGPAAPEAPQPEATSFGALKPAESTLELLDSLRQGLSTASFLDDEVKTEPAVDTGEDTAGLFATNGNFTTTNLQEAGVEEADILKYDGEILYFIQREDNALPFDQQPADAALIAPQPQSSRIQLLRTDVDTPSVTQLASIDLSNGSDWFEGLYIHESANGKFLVALGGSHSASPVEALALDYYWQDGQTSVTVWDVTDPATPLNAWKLELDGRLLASRRIDNRLYLVTRFTPSVEGVIDYPQTQEQVDANQELISSAPLHDLLPDYRLDDGPPAELLSAQDCYLPNPDYEGGQGATAGGGIVTVTSIDLTGAGNPQSLCLNTDSDGYYVSPQSLYVSWGGADNATLVHKIHLGESGPEYRGSGQVPGYLGTQNPAFLMSESGKELRVVSSLWTERPEPFTDNAAEVDTSADYGPHRLTVLKENIDGTELEQLAQIPNAAHTEKIGKPGEQVYAARFVDDRAYIVTFEIIDPLYVIDLSTPEDPRVSGELELPGFSTMLQPLGQDLLLGIGHDVPPEAEGLVQGIKIALFDVANIQAPAELASEVIGKRGSYSPALSNHHSLSVQTTDDGHRIALPIVRHAFTKTPDMNPPNSAQWYNWSDTGLYLFDIASATGELSLRDTLLVEQREDETSWPQLDVYNARAVIHENAVFFLVGDQIRARKW
ncbi:beta-propeller domain-containing protein [Pseudohalioglobus lutimaris]|uniref:Uncharacterized protein n=1 Tax=Pseudohalioglobus lutimaris TaxID=1737061 RepID=A0A2N5X7V7_9GAMM|nr:beta-propeller domain-containing protein [Pseudohalioglobus lutimaris]PLW70575.1 hypothetical protein C0039_00115 [Pseudohalioglobus lutimaris]